jgi:hypothetical protein
MNEIKKNYEILSTAIHEINLSKQQSVNLIDVQLVWASDLNLDTSPRSKLLMQKFNS